jgi:hypothetical protein
MPFLGIPAGAKLNTNVILDAITTSATATYALTKDSAAYTPKSVQALLVSLNGVTQAPTAAYTISGSNIVFASALTSNDVIDYIIAFEGDVTSLDVSNISAGDIATSMLADDAVTAAKIADDAVVTAAIADDAITSALIADDAVVTAAIADDAITSALIADDAVGSDQLAGSLTVDINGGTVDGAVIGGSSAAAGTFTTVTDGAGAIRAIPKNTQGSAYSLVVGDVGKVIDAAGTVTIPNATFSAGDAVSIFNNTTSDLTITCTITTAYKAGTNADIATATLATRGVATILFISGTVCVIAGNI